MIFWILTVIAVLGIIFTFAYFIMDEGWGFGLGIGFLVSLLIAMVWGLIAVLLVGLAIPQMIGPNKTESYRTELRALGTDDSLSGRSYLFSGRLGHDQRFSYIAQEDGYSRLGDVDADVSRVFEDEEKDPYMVTWVFSSDYWWLFPAPTEYSRSYDFHIPEGSVSTGYEVEP